MRIEGSTILVTGGTGSFGNRVARHLLQRGVKKIRIFSRDEKKQWEMQRAFPDFEFWIGDVRDQERVSQAMRGVDFVFHAAALKHVPACEKYPMEALKTNTMGTYNVCEAAKRAGVRMVVALSTDKAVKPVNTMGMSKALAEKIVCNENATGDETIFCCVRYGNVIGSRGSVVPLFMSQIAAEKPITITMPGMTRFLLTLDQAVGLVFYAFENARGGEIFVRKSPACTVQLLAETMRNKYSKRRSDHPIVVTGVRPGEKAHEVLVNEYEILRSRNGEGFFVIAPEYRTMPSKAVVVEPEEYTSANTTRLTTEESCAAVLDAMGDVEVYV